jgi:hypothetical protein
MKTMTVGFEFRASVPDARCGVTLLDRMALDYTAFEAQLLEFQRTANMGREKMEEMARKAEGCGAPKHDPG